MCTVVVRWSAASATQLLALRDELTNRDFDDPDAWWPDQPDVVGGRDRSAGGTWCASRVTTGVNALVLNRPRKRVADEGAPSRGVLPLLAAQHEDDWPAHIDLRGMASFALVLAGPDRLMSWDFDGTDMTQTQHEPGTHMFTSGGAEDGKAARYLARFASTEFPDSWRELVQAQSPTDDLGALVVRRAFGDRVYGTVFGQLIDARPGSLTLEYSREPWTKNWTRVSLGE